MDIRSVSEEDKMAYINRIKAFFGEIRNTLNTLEADIENKDLEIQASSVWISGNLCNWYTDFVKEIQNIHHKKNEIQQQITEIANEKNV